MSFDRRRAALSASLVAKSRQLVALVDARMETVIAAWIAVIVLAGLAKIATAPLGVHGLGEGLAMLLPYLLIALAPILGYRVAEGSFPRGQLSAQPAIRLARLGRWRSLDPLAARSNPLYGPAGFVASLLIGILLNVPVRTMEYLAAVPAVGAEGPAWAHVIFLTMTADVVLMNFFYAVCFVAALRSVPLFPRLMLFAWTLDLALQLGIARFVAAAPGLPETVAAPMATLLIGNVKKVLISAALWLPYLILSERVNVTYRHRQAA